MYTAHKVFLFVKGGGVIPGKFRCLSRTSKTNNLVSSFRQSPAPAFNHFVLPSHCYEFGERIKRTSSLLQSIRLILFPDQNSVHSSRLYNETSLNYRTWFRACSMCGVFTLRARRYSVLKLLSIFVDSSAKNMDKTTEDKHLQRQY